MHKRMGRAGAVIGLFVAILSDLRRRAWWAYRRGALTTPPPRTTIVARRDEERSAHIPVVTPAWRAVVARSLPAQAAAVTILDQAVLPLVWIDTQARPDIADLPRVMTREQQRGDRSVIATQWLVGEPNVVVLIVTVAEPVICTWAISFDLHHWQSVLEQIAVAEQLFVTWGSPPLSVLDDPSLVFLEAAPLTGLHLPLRSASQLRAILSIRTPDHP